MLVQPIAPSVEPPPPISTSTWNSSLCVVNPTHTECTPEQNVLHQVTMMRAERDADRKILLELLEDRNRTMSKEISDFDEVDNYFPISSIESLNEV